jgi:hypothetical protein
MSARPTGGRWSARSDTGRAEAALDKRPLPKRTPKELSELRDQALGSVHAVAFDVTNSAAVAEGIGRPPDGAASNRTFPMTSSVEAFDLADDRKRARKVLLDLSTS